MTSTIAVSRKSFVTDLLLYAVEVSLKEYLHAYWDKEKLAALQARYVKDFDDYREQRWMERRRLRTNDSEEAQQRPAKYLAVAENERSPPDSPQAGSQVSRGKRVARWR